MPFEVAQRKRAFMKIGVTGPAGAGKTFSSLLLAQGFVGEGGRIALADTEHGSGELYSDAPGIRPYGYQRIVPPFTVEKYERVINEAVNAKFDLLIIDSISHAWAGEGGILEQRDNLESSGKARGMQAWARVTKDQNRLIERILQSPIHIIATMRSKTAYLIGEENGRQKVTKVGMAPVQREGVDYELSVVFDLTREHIATASKDRTNLFDRLSALLTEEHGARLRDWMDSGGGSAAVQAPGAPKREAPAPRPVVAAPPPEEDRKALFRITGDAYAAAYVKPEEHTKEAFSKRCAEVLSCDPSHIAQMTADEMRRCIEAFRLVVEDRQAEQAEEDAAVDMQAAAEMDAGAEVESLEAEALEATPLPGEPEESEGNAAGAFTCSMSGCGKRLTEAERQTSLRAFNAALCKLHQRQAARTG